MAVHLYGPAHFLALGRRVENAWTGETGTVVPCPAVLTGEVLVEWDDSDVPTLCWPDDLEPLEA